MVARSRAFSTPATLRWRGQAFNLFARPRHLPADLVPWHHTIELDALDTVSRVSPCAEHFLFEVYDLPARRVLGRPAWDLIQDETARHVFDLAFTAARRGEPQSLREYGAHDQRGPYDCGVEVSATREGGVRVFWWLQPAAAQQPPIVHLSSDRLARMCSWCKRVETRACHWNSTTEASPHLGVLRHGDLPRITHGICPECLSAHFPESAQATGALAVSA